MCSPQAVQVAPTVDDSGGMTASATAAAKQEPPATQHLALNLPAVRIAIRAGKRSNGISWRRWIIHVSLVVPMIRHRAASSTRHAPRRSTNIGRLGSGTDVPYQT